MTDWILTDDFAAALRDSFDVSEVRPEFVEQVYTRLMQRAENKSHYARIGFRLRTGWVVTFALVVLIAVSVLVIGPQRVYAEFAKLLGYIPGVGLVDESAPIRVLAEPVSVTSDGVTITVTSATLTADRTQIVYRIFGLPASAYPTREDVEGCMPGEYLRLADGTKLVQINGGYEPVPAKMNRAVLVIPCIANTLPGKAPENWELPLRFVPAPSDLTVMPVIELTPSPQMTQTQSTTANVTSTAQADNAVTVSKEIETSDGYILIGQFQPQTGPGESIQVTGPEEIVDATGKKVSYSFPMDVSDEIGLGWGAQFKAAGLTYPLTIRFSGVVLQPADSTASANFTFDAGSNPQPGQVWNLNQEIQLDGHTLTLASITANSQGSYSFDFRVDPKVYGVGVQIEGATPNGGGGGGGGGLTGGRFETSLSYATLPTGLLTITVSNLTLIGDSHTWQGQWSPATIRTDLPVNPTPQPGLCLTQDSAAQLQPAPTALLTGTALMFELLENSDKSGLVLYHLDGSVRQVLAEDAGDGSLSPDGTLLAYPSADGTHIIGLQTKSEKVLSEIKGGSLHWSPNGKKIAFIASDDKNINSLSVVNIDGTDLQQISNLSYESVIGWSADSQQVYYVIPYTGGAAWKVYAYDLTKNALQELFTIENGTPKFLNPQLSPDGQWIAYRGRDNSSIYLVHPDGSEMHLLIDNTGVAGIAWSQSGWLGVSMGMESSQNTTVVLLKPDTCEAYLLPNLHGELEGLSLP